MKYPIILVHGLALKDVIFFKAFGFIERFLTKEGYRVYTAPFDGFGSIENNASQLHDFILKICNEQGCKKVNIIAHSKGGLDTKYMLENSQNSDMVASVTTLCTPFDGAPLADKILALPLPIVKIFEIFLNTAYKISGDKHPDALTVGKQLVTRARDEHFAEKLPIGVYWQSYSLEKDGMVPAASAKFLNYRGHGMPEYIDHTKIVGQMVFSKKQKREVEQFYSELCQGLEKEGF